MYHADAYDMDVSHNERLPEKVGCDACYRLRVASLHWSDRTRFAISSL